MAIPEPAGHYSPYVVAHGFLYTAGQLAIVGGAVDDVPDGAHEQTILVLEKIENILAEEGLDRRSIVKTTAFISNGEDWGIVNGAYQEFFGDHKPARTIVPVSELHFGCKVEIEAIAAFPPN